MSAPSCLTGTSAGSALPDGELNDIPFVKMHGLGNNFAYVDCMERPLDNLAGLAALPPVPYMEVPYPRSPYP